MTNAILKGMPDVGNPHVRFDEGVVAPVKQRRGFLLCNSKKILSATLALAGVAASADTHHPETGTSVRQIVCRVYDRGNGLKSHVDGSPWLAELPSDDERELVFPASTMDHAQQTFRIDASQPLDASLKAIRAKRAGTYRAAVGYADGDGTPSLP